MARPLKKGLDYFPMDTKLDFKLQLLKAKYKLEGIGFIDLLYRKIYEEGYFIKIETDTVIMLSNDFGISEERFSELLNFCVEKEFFSKEIYKKYGVLTSNGIQKRYFHKSLKRQGTKKYEFLTSETELSMLETGVIATDKCTNKIKVNEIILKYNKLKEIKEFPLVYFEWIEFRESIKKPMKDSTIKKQLDFLEKQEDPIAVINKSIMNGWQGLFELKGKNISLVSNRRNNIQTFENLNTY